MISIYYSISTCLLLGTLLQRINAFTSTSTRTFLETTIPRVTKTKLNLIFSEPVDIPNQSTTVSTSNSILISSSVASTFKNNFPIGQSIHPTVNDYAKLPSNVESALESLEKKYGTKVADDNNRGFQILGVSDDPYNLASAPDYLKSKETKQPEIINPKELEFLALELDFLPKLPLAAAIYVAFEFFFMNIKQQIEEEEAYENEMYYDEEEEEAREVTQFWSVVALRTFAAFAITFASLFISKLDIAQINSFIR